MKNKKKNRKQLFSLLLVLLLTASLLTGCGDSTADEGQSDADGSVTSVIHVAALNGPTGMGMVKLMDMTDKYEVTAYQAPTDIAPKLINGEVDVAAMPSNMAAVLYNKTEGQIKAISPIALGVLYILGNNAEVTEIGDLAGKTIVASGQGGTPEYVLQKVLEHAGLAIDKDVKVEWLASHADVNTKLLSEEGTIAMIPEPFVSAALAAGGESAAQLFDLNALWQEATGQELPMGVLIARKAFVEEREADLKVLLADYQTSVDFVNNTPAEAAEAIASKGFIGKAAIAEAAIPNCHIVLYSGEKKEEGAAMLKTFNETLFAMEPASVGGSLPGDDLYY